MALAQEVHRMIQIPECNDSVAQILDIAGYPSRALLIKYKLRRGSGVERISGTYISRVPASTWIIPKFFVNRA